MVKYKFRLAGLARGQNEKIIEIDVGPEETVADVKKKIREKWNMDKTLDIELIFNEKTENEKKKK